MTSTNNDSRDNNGHKGSVIILLYFSTFSFIISYFFLFSYLTFSFFCMLGGYLGQCVLDCLDLDQVERLFPGLVYWLGYLFFILLIFFTWHNTESCSPPSTLASYKSPQCNHQY